MLTIGEQNITLTQAVIVKKKVTSVNNGLFLFKIPHSFYARQ